jgi:hypothetical protein
MTRADESETRRAEGPRVDARDVASRGDDATRRAHSQRFSLYFYELSFYDTNDF